MKPKQSLRRIIDYTSYNSFSEFLDDVTIYVDRILMIIKNNRFPNQDKRTRKLIRLGQEVGHLPFTYLSGSKEKKIENEQTKSRLEQYLMIGGTNEA